MNTNVLLGFLGLLGGLLCLVADFLLDYKSKDNQKLGQFKIVDSDWQYMAAWRFKASLFLAAVGVCLYSMGFLSLSLQMMAVDHDFGVTFLAVSGIGALGGLFIHATLCYYPIISNNLGDKLPLEEKVNVLGALFDAAKFPFILMYACLVFFSSILLIVAIQSGILVVPAYCYFFNPLVVTILGMVVRGVLKNRIPEIPGFASLGIALMGVVAMISARGGL